METATKKAPVVRSLTARVVSARMDKTASVEMSRTVKHPMYGKFLRRRTKLLAHDEANECRAGDVVTISPCRPLSKRKSWRITAIIERAAETSDTSGTENAEELAP